MVSSASTRVRLGITLLEVLVSIGVLSIGLLGVVLLIPIAHHKAAQATLEDRKANVGRRAFHEFRLRGMARPRSWVSMAGGSPSLPVPMTDNSPLNQRPLYQPYCIDPRMIGHIFNAAPANLPVRFPATGTIWMERLTLAPIASTTDASVMMPSQQADEVFTFKDDLIFEIPSKPELPPKQTSLKAAIGGNEVPAKRAFEGQFSWMATLAPDPVLGDDMYVLSAVIFYQRLLDPTLETSIPITSSTTNSDSSGSNYLGGNDIQLSLPATDPRFETFQKKLRIGNWLLLAQVEQLPNGQTRNRFKWVQVIAANDGDSDTSRIVTYAGHDWNWNTPTEVTFVPGVVSVYEKSIRLDGSSMWQL